MLKSVKSTTKDYIGAVGLGFSIATVYVILVAHASAVSFKAGYLSYFDIDIRHVNYWPSIADFMNEPLLVLTAIFILQLICLGAILLINLFHWVIRKYSIKYKWKRIQHNFQEKPYGIKITAGISIALLLFLSIKLPFFDAYDRGIAAAKDQENFTVIVSDDSKRQALIYQDRQTGLFKTYDTDAKVFSKTYEPVDITGLSFEVVRLIK